MLSSIAGIHIVKTENTVARPVEVGVRPEFEDEPERPLPLRHLGPKSPRHATRGGALTNECDNSQRQAEWENGEAEARQ